jgi:hypothetical protein
VKKTVCSRAQHGGWGRGASERERERERERT